MVLYSSILYSVIPAKAGIQLCAVSFSRETLHMENKSWIPAFAGMTS
jgi:hypothetical protein